jgi:hypothetical protein
MDVIEAIMTRRSIGLVSAEKPPRQLIDVLPDAGVQEPNDHETQPWRFLVLTGAAREDGCEILAIAPWTRISGEDEQEVDDLGSAEKLKPLRTPDDLDAIIDKILVDFDNDRVRQFTQDFQSKAARYVSSIRTWYQTHPFETAWPWMQHPAIEQGSGQALHLHTWIHESRQ